MRFLLESCWFKSHPVMLKETGQEIEALKDVLTMKTDYIQSHVTQSINKTNPAIHFVFKQFHIRGNLNDAVPSFHVNLIYTMFEEPECLLIGHINSCISRSGITHTPADTNASPLLWHHSTWDLWEAVCLPVDPQHWKKRHCSLNYSCPLIPMVLCWSFISISNAILLLRIV